MLAAKRQRRAHTASRGMQGFADFEDAADRGVSLSFLEKLVVKQNLSGARAPMKPASQAAQT